MTGHKEIEHLIWQRKNFYKPDLGSSYQDVLQILKGFNDTDPVQSAGLSEGTVYLSNHAGVFVDIGWLLVSELHVGRRVRVLYGPATNQEGQIKRIIAGRSPLAYRYRIRGTGWLEWYMSCELLPVVAVDEHEKPRTE